MRSSEELFRVFFEAQCVRSAFTEPPDVIGALHEGVAAVRLAILDDLISLCQMQQEAGVKHYADFEGLLKFSKETG